MRNDLLERLFDFAIRVIKALEFNNINQKEIEWLVNESKELKLILGAIVQKTRQ